MASSLFSRAIVRHRRSLFERLRIPLREQHKKAQWEEAIENKNLHSSSISELTKLQKVVQRKIVERTNNEKMFLNAVEGLNEEHEKLKEGLRREFFDAVGIQLSKMNDSMKFKVKEFSGLDTDQKNELFHFFGLFFVCALGATIWVGPDYEGTPIECASP